MSLLEVDRQLKQHGARPVQSSQAPSTIHNNSVYKGKLQARSFN